MNYEEFYAEMTPLKKNLKDSVSAVTKYDKAILKAMENGNLTEMKKTLDLLKEAVSQLQERTEKVSDCVAGFDTDQYFICGDFARQLEQSCRDRGVDVKGGKGIFEMFPYKVRVYGDEDHAGEVYINRKKLPSVRPAYVADTIAQGREKLYNAAFNAASFMGELAAAYDLTILKDKARPGAALMLTKIYKTMTPMARARKEYDMQAFSFDLARLYEKGPDAWVSKDGRIFVFGPGRKKEEGIRVLSSTGMESFIMTMSEINSF